MKNTIISCVFALGAVAASAAAPKAIPTDRNIEKRVEQTLRRMTLDEKIGQMTELSIDVLGSWQNGEFQFDPQKLHDAIAVYKVGSILNAPGAPTAQTPEKWQQLIRQVQELSMKEIGIPCIYGLDQNHGTTYTLGGVLFPQNINVGASFDPDMAHRIAEITAYETRAANCPWTYSPNVDLTRDPRWSRVWENFGEDPLLNSVMGVQMVKGFQGTNPNVVDQYHVGTSVKHYLGYGAARTGKDRTPAYIAPSDIREKYFAPFKACAEAGALTIMVNSGSINNLPLHADPTILTQWLKKDLGWDGVLLTDWADINNLFSREYIAADKKEAIAMAINAGIDMSMDPYDTNFCTLLKEAVQEKKVPMSRIDDAVRRVLRLKYRLGLFDTPNTDLKDYPEFGGAAHRAVALKAAEESEVLLKNKNGILPLSKGVKILVTGPNANSMRCLNGGWSYSWQGHIADQYADEYNTLYEALANKFGADNVSLEQGVTYKQDGLWHEENAPEIEKAVAAAQNADVIVACVGENSYCETPGNLSDLALSTNQRDLVKALASTGKPIILVLNEGRPRLISDIEPLADAVIDILLPGNFGADALANIIAGDANPSAKMPYTYPRHSADLTTYDYRVSEEVDRMEGAYDYDAVISVQWPFGYGQSYTTFDYGNMTCSRPTFGPADTLTFSVDVTNAGTRAGKETVMLFSRDMVASLTPENRRLRGFEKVELLPGETRTVSISIPASDLAFVGHDGKWRLEKGLFRMQMGTQTLPITCSDTKVWTAPNI